MTMLNPVMIAKSIASMSDGRVRRHNTVGATATMATTESSGQERSVRSRPSITENTTMTARSAQSRHTRRGGAGTARGEFHIERSRRVIPS